MPERKPLIKMQESRDPYTVRLKPSTIEQVKTLALAKGLGHTTFARECFLRGLRMAQLEDLEKEDTRVTA